MAKVVLLNKPFDVLCQFSDSHGRQTLSGYISDPSLRRYYPAGRLDRDSEGLVLLTDNGQLQHRISHPKHKLSKIYWVQVEGEISSTALQQMRNGILLNDGPTLPAKVEIISPPVGLWPRPVPIRERKNIPTSWIQLTINEGRNRQVRRMTAALGYPTLRLVRTAIGDWQLGNLSPGEYCVRDVHLPISKPKALRKNHARKFP